LLVSLLLIRVDCCFVTFRDAKCCVATQHFANDLLTCALLAGTVRSTYDGNSDVSVNYCVVRLLDFTLRFLTAIQTPCDLQTTHVIPKIEVFVLGLTLLGL